MRRWRPPSIARFDNEFRDFVAELSQGHYTPQRPETTDRFIAELDMEGGRRSHRRVAREMRGEDNYFKSNDICVALEI